jgi:hypothetical protein
MLSQRKSLWSGTPYRYVELSQRDHSHRSSTIQAPKNASDETQRRQIYLMWAQKLQKLH